MSLLYLPACVHVCFCLSVYFSCMPICDSVSACLSVCLLYPSNLFISPLPSYISVNWPMYLCICLFVCQTICLFVISI
uniref:Secreted protein n=1 Tax=Xenopsylla cheopis TaxID=163159 RepID=A0A6M2E2Y1_XENCH